jgi:hypothetical protein
MKRRQTIKRISMVERALIAADWRTNIATSRIHAIMGDNSDALCNRAGSVMFVVLGAALAAGTDENDAEIRIMRGAVNVLYEQSGAASVLLANRAPLLSGLEAAVRLLVRLPAKAIVDAACDLHLKLKKNSVSYYDFLALAGPQQQGEPAHG